MNRKDGTLRTAARLACSALLVIAMSRAQGQVLISLLFGDKLNTGNIEFGLEGGGTWSSLSGVDGATVRPGWNLGFYFDFKTRSKWRIATGVMVKSPWGAEGLPVYSLGDAALDSVFVGGSVTRKLNYFNVPIMAKYPIGRFFVMAGPQLSLGYKAYDVFTKEVQDPDDLTYELDTRDSYRAIDAGVVGAFGYRLMKGYGMNLLVRYYQGLTDIRKDPVGAAQTNRGWHVLVGIPIGVGKAQQRQWENELKKVGAAE